jgi:hypothetical protein
MPELSSIAVVADQNGNPHILALARAAFAGEPFEGEIVQRALEASEPISIGRPEPGLWQADTDLAVAGNVDGRLEVVAVGGDGALWHAWQRQPGGPWSSWDSLDAPPEHERQAGSPVLGRNEDGRLELFTVAAGAVWHRWQQRAGQGPWHDWHSLEQPSGSRLSLGSLAVAQNHDGRLELFAVDLAGGGWSQWQGLDNPGVAPRGPLGLGRQEDGCLVLFLATADGGLWRRSQQGPGAGPWEPWEPLDTPSGGLRLGFGARAVGAHEDGRLVLVTIHKPQPPQFPELWLVEQTDPNGSWAGRSLGRHPIADLSPGLVGIKIASPAVASRADGRLVLFFVIWGSAVFLYRLHQDRPNDSTWMAGIEHLLMAEWD